jgi:hypothetical protein
MTNPAPPLNRSKTLALDELPGLVKDTTMGSGSDSGQNPPTAGGKGKTFKVPSRCDPYGDLVL